jgi:hypothetical protein
MTTDKANLEARITQLRDEYGREKEQYTAIIRQQRDALERKETILDHPDGKITYVDYEQREVHVDINRRMGARPQMVMSVFDLHAPGIPTEKPKGTIELTQIGESFSVARITKTFNSIDPIREGDLVYSPAWSPNTPMRFALVGKIDINRDGRDDRLELKRMIEEAGGVVDFDLPPGDVGRETGKLSPQIDWYVTDERPPFHEVYNARSEPILRWEAELKKRMGEVIKEARLDGIRPMPIQRLLNYLGYDINTPVVGRSEGVNTEAIRRLTAKRQPIQPAAPKPTATADQPKAEEPTKDKDGDQPK